MGAWEVNAWRAAPEGWEEGKALSSAGRNWSVIDMSSVDFRESSRMEVRESWNAEQ